MSYNPLYKLQRAVRAPNFCRRAVSSALFGEVKVPLVAILDEDFGDVFGVVYAAMVFAFQLQPFLNQRALHPYRPLQLLNFGVLLPQVDMRANPCASCRCQPPSANPFRILPVLNSRTSVHIQWNARQTKLLFQITQDSFRVPCILCKTNLALHHAVIGINISTFVNSALIPLISSCG